MKRPIKLAFGRIFHEGNSFSPVPTTIDDFKRFHWNSGKPLLHACGRLAHEIPGFLKSAELSGFVQACRKDGDIQPVPLCSMITTPSGPIQADNFDMLVQTLLDSLRDNAPYDGVYLALHGAMRVQRRPGEPIEYGDGDARILEAVRQVIGKDTPLAVSLDLHANLNLRKLEQFDIMCMYQTNPHRDFVKVGKRAQALLAQYVRGQIKPVQAYRSLPMVMGGGMTMDFLNPMRAIFRAIKQAERRPGVLRVNLSMAHIFSDAPDLGWAVHVITDNDPTLAEQVADEIAALAWRVRHDMPPRIDTPRRAFEEAKKSRRWASKMGIISMPDLSDVVGAGGVGENTNILNYLLNHPTGLRVALPVRDPQVVETLWQTTPSTQVSVNIGGRLDPENNPQVLVNGRLLGRFDDDRYGKAVVIKADEVTVIVTERPPLTIMPNFFSGYGVDLSKHDVVIQKSMFHYRFFFAWRSLRHIGIQTRGTTNLDAYKSCTYNRPVSPLQDVQWPN